MNKICVWIVLLLMAMSSSSICADEMDQPIDNSDQQRLAMNISCRYFDPNDSDQWKDGKGAQIQFEYWRNDYVGAALFVGCNKWDAEDQVGRDFEPTTVNATVDAGELVISGDLSYYPVGGAILFRALKTDYVSIAGQGGLQYSVVRSDLNAQGVLTLSDGVVVVDDRVNVENSWQTFLLGEVDVHITETITLFAAGGYQWDLTKGERESNSTYYNNENVRRGVKASYQSDNSFEGAFVQGGVKFEL